MRAVDTNILVRLIARDDPKQLVAAEEFVAAGAWVSHIVLVETAWVLDAVFSLPPDRIALALEHYRSNPGLGFSDCMVLESARKAGHLPLGTFDRKLSKLPGAERL